MVIGIVMWRNYMMLCQEESLFEVSYPKEDFLIRDFSSGNRCNSTARNKLEHRLSEKLFITDKYDRKSVSFQLSKEESVHSWFKYKEGFSANLVESFIGELGLGEGNLVLDPLLGSGTTGLVCREYGINTLGYDILPTSTIAIEAKVNIGKYNVLELKNLCKEISKIKVPNNYSKRVNFIPITEGAYPEDNDVFFAFLKEWIYAQDCSPQSKKLVELCILNSLEECSYTAKSGQYLSWDYRSDKVKKNNEKRIFNNKKILKKKVVRPFIKTAKEEVINELSKAIRDISLVQNHKVKNWGHIEYKNCNVLYDILKQPDSFVDGVITSPPYCNRYDYTRTYALELAFLGVDNNSIKELRQELLSCTVESKSKKDYLKKLYNMSDRMDDYSWIVDTIENNEVYREVVQALTFRNKIGDLNNSGIIRMVEGYFLELGFLFFELFRVCKKGAKVVFVNDNVRYGGEVIPVDFLCSELAENMGFQVYRIYSLRQKKGNSSQQMAKYGNVPLRKSITVWSVDK